MNDDSMFILEQNTNKIFMQTQIARAKIKNYHYHAISDKEIKIHEELKVLALAMRFY